VTAVATVPTRTSTGSIGRIEEARSRAIGALLTCIARHGLAKTTLEDVAREAGCARATLYRHFGDKRRLVEAALASEADRVATAALVAAAAADTLPAAVAAVVATGSRELRDHAAFEFLTAYEPETILPHLSFTGFDNLLAAGAPLVAPAYDRFLPPSEAARLAEWTVRVVFTCGGTLSPIDLADGAVARRFVANYLPINPRG